MAMDVERNPAQRRRYNFAVAIAFLFPAAAFGTGHLLEQSFPGTRALVITMLVAAPIDAVLLWRAYRLKPS